MKILTKPNLKKDPGIAVNIPNTVKKHIAPWATVEYKRYNFGHLLIQELITKKYSLFTWRFYIEKPIKLYVHCDKPTLALQYMLLGDIVGVLKGFGKLRLEQGQYSMFYIPAEMHEIFFEKGTYESFHIEFTSSYVSSLSNQHKDIKQVINKLNHAHEHGERLSFFKVNRNITSVINELRNSTKTNGSLDILINSCIYKLISFYDEHTTTATNLEKMYLYKAEQVLAEIKTFIQQNPDIHECKAENISRLFSISIRELKRNFKNKYTISLRRFVEQECMERAKNMLHKNMGNVKKVATECGYSDQSNFSKAFKKYFGHLPNETKKMK